MNVSDELFFFTPAPLLSTLILDRLSMLTKGEVELEPWSCNYFTVKVNLFLSKMLLIITSIAKACFN
jgi:hypothetical protein